MQVYSTLQCFLFANIVFLLCHPYISEMLYFLPHFMVFLWIAIMIIYFQDTSFLYVITSILIWISSTPRTCSVYRVRSCHRVDRLNILKHCITICTASTLFCVTLVVVAIFPPTLYCKICQCVHQELEPIVYMQK